MTTQTPNNDTTRKAPIEVEMEELLGTGWTCRTNCLARRWSWSTGPATTQSRMILVPPLSRATAHPRERPGPYLTGP